MSCTMTPMAREDEGHVVMCLEITRESPHCATWRKVWVLPPKKDPKANEPGVCALRSTSMGALCGVGMHFELFSRQATETLGFVAGSMGTAL